MLNFLVSIVLVATEPVSCTSLWDNAGMFDNISLIINLAAFRCCI